MIDLHCHSRYSDGTFTPQELIKEAEKEEIEVLALTDHDTIDGIEPFLNTSTHISKVSGLEISIDWDSGTFHLVGLFVDHNNEELKKNLKILQQYRRERNEILLNNLSNLLGTEVKAEDITDENFGELGRPHIAKFMVKKGLVKDIDEAFEKYLGKGKPLYVPKKRLSIEDSISLIKSSGGISIIAHPITLILEDENEFFSKMKKIGVDGIEAYCSLHTEKEIQKYLYIAEKFGFLVSVGSDFHGANKSDAKLGKHGCSREDSFKYYKKMLEYLAK